MIYLFYTQTRTAPNISDKTKPQEYMSKLFVTNYDEAGKPKEALSADYWEFNPILGCSDLIKAHVTVFKDNGDIWYLSANEATAWHPTISDKITKIDMQNGVVIERPEHNHAAPIHIETLALEYTPDQEMITSKELVSMRQPGLMISGYGLLGYLERNWIELHDKITTIYTPN